MDVTVQHMHDVLSLKIPSPANMKPTIYYLINNMNYIFSEFYNLIKITLLLLIKKYYIILKIILKYLNY